MRFFTYLLLTGLCAGALYTLNPDLDDFDSYLLEHSNQIAKADMEQDDSVHLLFGFEQTVEPTFEHQDYLLFSIYKMTDGQNEERSYIGVASRFIELK